MEILINRKLL